MLNNPTFPKQPSFKAPPHRMWLWTGLLVVVGILATLLVVTASANPPNAAEVRLQGLVNELRQDRLTAQRHAAQRELEAAGDAAVPALIVAMRSTDSTMRRNAADMLGFIAAPGSIDALETALKNDTVPAVRRNAAWALGNIASFASIPELERAAVFDHSQIVRQTALDSLARVRTRIALLTGLDERNLNAYAVAPQDPEIVYAAAGRDLLVTSDSGASWQSLSAALPSMANVLAVSPADSKTVYAGIDSLGMFKSSDGGRSWKPVNTGLDVPPGARFVITDVAIDPIDDQHIVIATGIMLGTSSVDFYSTGLRISKDGGLTWHAREWDSANEPLTQLIVEGDQVYAIAGNQPLMVQLD
jgi:hypothetical protein